MKSRLKTQQKTTEPRPSSDVVEPFVGTGPGDPGLLTVRAVELIARRRRRHHRDAGARGAVRVVLGLPAPRSSSRRGRRDGRAARRRAIVDGGYGEDGQPLTHASRGEARRRHAKAGGNVVRLISGDPWMYATGAEEAPPAPRPTCRFEIVPGVSSVTAVPAYAGVPLTDRTSREVTVLNVADAKIDWAPYADDADAGAARPPSTGIGRGRRRR